MADDARILAIWRRKRDILKTAREARVTAGRVGEVVRRNRYRHHREMLAAQARKALASLPASEQEAGNRATDPCGGCGETDSSKRCIGCMHDFGDAASAWVRVR